MGHSQKLHRNKPYKLSKIIFFASDQQQIWLGTAHPDSESDTMSRDQQQNGKEEEEGEGKEEEVDDVTASDFSINKHE